MSKPPKTRPLVKQLTKCAIYLPVRAFRKSMSKCRVTPKKACEISEMIGSSVRRTYGENPLDDKLEGYGYRFTGAGVHRRGYAFNDNQCILKVATDDMQLGYTGPEANMNEVDSYMEALADPRFEGVKGYINPIVAHATDYRWLVVPRARTDKNDHLSYLELNDVEETLRSKLTKTRVCCPDLHHGNIGKLEEKPVIIDSGFKMECRVPKEGESCPIVTQKRFSTIEI